jgi:hypothetical protein
VETKANIFIKLLPDPVPSTSLPPQYILRRRGGKEDKQAQSQPDKYGCTF